MHVDPIKPTLKAPGTMRLKLKYGKLLSSFAFRFNLRRYTEGVLRFCCDELQAGAYTRPLFSSTWALCMG